MALAEPGRVDDGAGEIDPSLLHISMVFVRPAEQGAGVGLPLVLHLLDVARSLDYRRVGVWTARENAPARKLYERAGMIPTGKRSASFRDAAPLRMPLEGGEDGAARPEVAGGD
jgi:GNAT superfamily N-acetyltransferase